MITHLPTFEDFHQTGLSYLCLAWSDLLSLHWEALEYKELESEEEDPEYPVGNLVAKHWVASTLRVATCASLIHQGAEMLIKARICAQSPFLLLRGNWYEKKRRGDTPFSDLITIDAQDLPKVHNIVATNQLTSDFTSLFDKCRIRRNKVTHGVAQIEASVEDLARDIQILIATLLGDRSWPAIRREYNNTQDPAPWADYHGVGRVGFLEEWNYITQLFTPAENLRFFNFPTKQRHYLCPGCHGGDVPPEPPILLSYLTTTNPGATVLYCIACNETIDVIRQACGIPSASDGEKCPGDVWFEGQCLVCAGTR